MQALSLHHVGVVVKDIGRSCDDYVTRFGFERRSEVIHDPLQTAYVQFLRFPGDASCVELVAPDGPESKLTRALARGGGLNHLCYATDHIEAAFKTMVGRGMRPVQAPVPAVAFPGRRIAWLIGRDLALVELVERGSAAEL